MFPARFQLVAAMNLCPCGARGDGGGAVLVLAAARAALPREALARAARPLRPVVDRAAPAGRRAGGRAGRGVRSRSRACARRARAGSANARRAGRTAADELLTRAVERLPLSGRGRARVARVARDDRRARRRRVGRARARRRGALVPHSRRSCSRDERARALAVFAAQRGLASARRAANAHGSRRFCAAFDERAVPRRPRRARLPLAAASRSRVPGAAALDPRPSARPLRARRGDARAARRARRSRSSARAPARRTAPHVARVARSRARRGRAVVVVAASPAASTAAAHRGALEAAATTVAVLGCGIDRDYPRAHAALAAQIAARGLIVSEYPPGVEPAPWRFPARNRIVAGLALATVVVEARERSGALITADLALEEGREVLAVPGEITSRCRRARTRCCGSARRRSRARPTCSRRSGSSRLRRRRRRRSPGPAGAGPRGDRRRAGRGRRVDPPHGARRRRARSSIGRARAARPRHAVRRAVPGGDAAAVGSPS